MSLDMAELPSGEGDNSSPLMARAELVEALRRLFRRNTDTITLANTDVGLMSVVGGYILGGRKGVRAVQYSAAEFLGPLPKPTVLYGLVRKVVPEAGKVVSQEVFLDSGNLRSDAENPDILDVFPEMAAEVNGLSMYKGSGIDMERTIEWAYDLAPQWKQEL